MIGGQKVRRKKLQDVQGKIRDRERYELKLLQPGDEVQLLSREVVVVVSCDEGYYIVEGKNSVFPRGALIHPDDPDQKK